MPANPRQRARKPAPPAGLSHPSLYVNRELSLLSFQRRVLEEAQDESNPLLERVKFLSIVGSNLDEFYMVRVAGLLNQVESGILDTGPDGMSPGQQLDAIREEYEQIMEDAHECRVALFDELRHAGIEIKSFAKLDEVEKRAARKYFDETIYPVLTPLAVDPGRPFPHISNLSLNFSIIIRGVNGDERFARLKVPDTLPQLVTLGGARGRSLRRHVTLCWIEDLIQGHMDRLFPGMEVQEAHLFHVTRDAELEIQELESGDLLETVEEGVQQRRFGAVVRLKVQESMPDSVLDLLRVNLELDDTDIYRINGPLAVSRLKAISSIDRPDLKYPHFAPAPLRAIKKKEDLFAAIRRSDILIHHPFDSFQTVVEFLKAAARDPQVLAIKMTLYRVGPNSPVVEALMEAVEDGKQVAVMVELKARFDEESNIEWARALERVGVHVVYGFPGVKVHSKVLLIVRKEGDKIRRYIHMSTGNYNAVTAGLYTDMGLLTCSEEFGADATDLFNYLTGYSAKGDYRQLLVAPVNLREKFEQMIRREIEHAKAGREARLIFKMNALVDQRIIRLLYEASQAGVDVDLICRGICCLRPGVEGISDRIHVRSIVGRFLEHTRIFYFRNGGKEEIYMGSADLMPRNINRRVETLFPVLKRTLVRSIKDAILKTYRDDSVKARVMNSDGTYERAPRPDKLKAVDSQALLLKTRKNRA
ncbi:MAG: polyphosphate kinase 1 [Bryobacteraceae bacterium]|nr:polyphosphate kinase 1 [Bryobacteraceae bacterium]